MLPYKSIIEIDRSSEMPIYLQIAKGIIDEIGNGRIPPGSRLPSTRQMAEWLDVHRKTIVAAYNELDGQGWIESKKTSGTFVNNQLPIRQPIAVIPEKPSVNVRPVRAITEANFNYQFDDGAPDIRLAPLQALAREYSSLLKNSNFIRSLNYSEELKGDHRLRTSLANYFRETRGINVSIDQILVTRGSVMAFYLLLNYYLHPGEHVAVGYPGYWAFNRLITIHKGQRVPIPVDENGLDVDRLEECCRQKNIRLVYVISHHHHPTTVTLSPERRLKLLQLAERYNFMILEDDYDYDFHYNSSPVLPLASLQHQDRVVYVGSFSKTVAPGLRIGFLVGSMELVEQLSLIRRFIDRMGDFTLERAISRLLDSGEIRRHLNKSLQAYRRRRDFLCKQLTLELYDYVSFKVPEGGMAVWAKFASFINLDLLATNLKSRGLLISPASKYDTKELNYTRLGFACMNIEEMEKGFTILQEELKRLKP